MLMNIIIAAVLMVATTAIHAGGMTVVMHLNHRAEMLESQGMRKTRIHRVGVVVLLMFNVSLLEVLIWAMAFLSLNAIEGFEKAVYFSMVTFTTLGYGEIVLDERWRLLASFEAANGIIMFGWTTAIVMAVVQRVYFKEETKDVRSHHKK